LGLNKHTYQYDTIVVGGGLNAKIYAYYTKCPCISGNNVTPFRFDMLQEEMVQVLEGQGRNSLQVWEVLNFILGLSGQLPMGDKVSSINIRDNILKATTHDSRLGRFEFNKLIIFDDQGVFGLPLIRKQQIGKSRVLDWFDVRSGMEHDHDCFQTEDHFVEKVIFYPSDRFGNQTSGRTRKDLVAISHLDENQINNFDYSSTMARFKILQLMKDAGIKGARNGRDTYNPEIYRYYSPKIEASQREIIPDVTNYYEEDPRFEFRYDTADELIKQFSEEPDSYASKLLNLLTKTN
tara:strand:- start:272 stop:1150 length:879 start_codon:yes stop_codon:yes gene_type:complete